MAPPRGVSQGKLELSNPPRNEGKDNAAARQDWLQNVMSVGEQFNASLTSSRDLPRGISMISGRTADRPNQQRSDLEDPEAKRALKRSRRQHL